MEDGINICQRSQQALLWPRSAGQLPLDVMVNHVSRNVEAVLRRVPDSQRNTQCYRGSQGNVGNDGAVE